MPFDVFISFKHLDDSGAPTSDSRLADSIYSYLKERGLSPFSSEISLKEKGTSRYKRAIDSALDECSVLVAVATTPKHLESEWVRYEWDGFFNDILSGLKPEKKIFSYVDGILPNQLPRALRQAQSIVHGKDSLPRLYQFIVGDDPSRDSTLSPPPPSPDKQFVFISAASEDRAMVERIKDALREVGIAVFDSAGPELQAGTAWETEIEKKIRNCTLFIPVISSATEVRGPRWFRKEWAIAVERSMYFAHNIPFIIPVFAPGIDSPELIPEQFRYIHALRMDDELAVQRLASTAKTYVTDRA